MTYLDDAAALIRECLPGEAAPPPDADGLFLFYAVLVRAKGAETTLEDVHDAWAAWMRPLRPGHAALVPFAELEPAIQQADEPYLRAIHRAAALLSGPSPT